MDAKYACLLCSQSHWQSIMALFPSELVKDQNPSQHSFQGTIPASQNIRTRKNLFNISGRVTRVGFWGRWMRTNSSIVSCAGLGKELNCSEPQSSCSWTGCVSHVCQWSRLHNKSPHNSTNRHWFSLCLWIQEQFSWGIEAATHFMRSMLLFNTYYDV